MKKSTNELMNEIVACKNISQYFDANSDEFLEMPLHLYLKELLGKTHLSISQVAMRSYKGEYIYQVFRGVKNPGRDVILSIALALELNPDETRCLLRIAHMPMLDARNRRDSIIIFALSRKLSVPDTNDILYEYKMPCL